MTTKKKKDPSYLLGQLVGTVQCMEESLRALDNPMDNSLTVGELYFHEMIENPAIALTSIERGLAPFENQFHFSPNKQLRKELGLIYRLLNQYEFNNHPLNEEEYYRGYHEQIKKYADC